jgi:hypothetical protein
MRFVTVLTGVETSIRDFRHSAFFEVLKPQAESARVFTEAGHRGVSLIRSISASGFVDLAFSCTCSEVGWNFVCSKCARAKHRVVPG